MRGLEVPAEVVKALGSEKRPRVRITVNGHTWQSRIAIMRGRYLIGFSKANRAAAGVDTGDTVEVEIEVDDEPPVFAEPEDLARALDADATARAAFDRLSPSGRRRHIHSVDGAKNPETRVRRIDKVLETLRGKSH